MSKKPIFVVLLMATLPGMLVAAFNFQEAKAIERTAAIIDPLSIDWPNPDFNETGIVWNILESAGFNVSYHGYNETDVAFFKKLAELGYEVIVLRTHTARRAYEPNVVDFVTSEEYNSSKYIYEQTNDWLTKVQYSPQRGEYFAFTPKFIENLHNSFPGSVIVVMGCRSLFNRTYNEMAISFINKGARAYIGWTELVAFEHSDNQTIRFLQNFVVENETLSEAVNGTDPDPFYGGEMSYFPLSAGDLVIPEFPSFLILLLFMIATLPVVIAYSRKRSESFRA